MSEETGPLGKIVGAIQDAKNVVVDSIEKVSSPVDRAGHTVERVGKLVEGGVDKEVIALQMTKRSPTKKVYTEAAVDVLSDVYQDSKTTVLVTAGQTKALQNDQKATQPPKPHGDLGLDGALPA